MAGAGAGDPLIDSRSTATVCPVDCFFDIGEMLIIHPEECIDCGACVDECPVQAILPEDEVIGTPEESYVEKNKVWFEENISDEVEAARQTTG